MSIKRVVKKVRSEGHVVKLTSVGEDQYILSATHRYTRQQYQEILSADVKTRPTSNRIKSKVANSPMPKPAPPGLDKNYWELIRGFFL